MIKRQILRFLLRWLVSSLLMALCLNLFASFKEGYEEMQSAWWFYALAGLVFALVNSIARPLATILALPFLWLTLGVFTVVINVAMVGLTVLILPAVTMTFWGAVGSCVVISLVNLLANLLLSEVL